VKIVEASEEVKDEISSQLECAICMDVMKDPMTATPCMHNFCKKCIDGWLSTSYMRECPMCKQKILDMKRSPLIASIIETL
jgi:hypothetical protein